VQHSIIRFRELGGFFIIITVGGLVRREVVREGDGGPGMGMGNVGGWSTYMGIARMRGWGNR